MNGTRRDQLTSIPLLVMLMVLSTHNALAQSASRAATPRSEGSQRCNLWIPVLCRLRALKTRQNCLISFINRQSPRTPRTPVANRNRY